MAATVDEVSAAAGPTRIFPGETAVHENPTSPQTDRGR